MDHGKFVVKSTTKWRDNKNGKSGAENKGILNKKFGFTVQNNESRKIKNCNNSKSVQEA